MFDYGIIETKDLILRPIHLNDFKELHKNFYTDKFSASMMLWDLSKNLADSKLKVQEELNRVKNGNFYSYAIVQRLDNQVIGRIHFKVSKEDNKKIDSIGMGMGQRFTNKGYGTQALKAIIETCFERAGIQVIHSSYFPRNIASEKLQTKLGFIKYGNLFELKREYNNELEIVQPLILTKDKWKTVKI